MGSAALAAKAAFYGVIACWWGFVLTFWLRRRQPGAQATKRAPTSYLGLLLQATGYFVVWSRLLQQRPSSPLLADTAWLAWLLAVAGIAIAAASVVLVVWAARRLGKQWSLGARLVEGHDLITDGPYRFVRNPIYAGMFGMLIATGLVGTHWLPLLAAAALFLAGTLIRVRVEERLLRQAFGEQFDEYARRVPALIPMVY